MEKYLHGPTHYAKTLKLKFEQGISICQKDEIGTAVVGRTKTYICALGGKKNSKIHKVVECEVHKEERHVLKEMRQID